MRPRGGFLSHPDGRSAASPETGTRGCPGGALNCGSAEAGERVEAPLGADGTPFRGCAGVGRVFVGIRMRGLAAGGCVPSFDPRTKRRAGRP